MQLANEIQLRPRFKKRLNRSALSVLSSFNSSPIARHPFIVTVVDDHIFIKTPKEKQHFWSPQLHLEIIPVEESSCDLFGLFGPSPNVWTLFMFIHFLVATLFLGMGVWAYSNYSLGNPMHIQLVAMFLLVIVWIALYVIGKIGKLAGEKEMNAMYEFMNARLDS